MAEPEVRQDVGAVRTPTNPDVYVGPRPFQTGETLYCRDRETAELISLLISQRLVLFHSPSGAGKTSLIQANLVPKLQKRRFEVPTYQAPDQPQPHPIILRVNREPEPDDPPEANRYVLSVLLKLELHRPEDQRRGVAELAGLTLDQYLEAAFPAASREATDAGSDGGMFRPLLLMFDQFEELLTLDPTDRAHKAEFMRQVGEALQNQGRWALFGIREDFLGALEPYLPAIPTRLTATYRLDLLRAESAWQAIEKPAKLAGVEYEDGLIERLISDLRQVKVQRPDGSFEPKAGPYIEPVQLQVICQSLWQIKENASVITTAHLERLGGGRGTGVDDVLAAYYAQRVAQAAAEGGVAERTIRDWFGKQLISAQGVRRPVLVNEALAAGLTPACLQVLDKAFLIRRDNRSGAQWYELAHDRLVTPVSNDNTVWRNEHLNTFQRQAALWEDSNRRPDLLVTGAVLTEGENWAEGRGVVLERVEEAFLEECRKRQDRRMLFIAGMLALALAAVLATYFGFQARDREREAVKQKQRADGATKEAEIERDRARRQSYASLIRLAQWEWQYGNPSTAWRYLNDCQWDLRGWEHDYLFTQFTRGYRILRGHSEPVNCVAFSRDGKWLASTGYDTIKIWESSTGKLLRELKNDDTSQAIKLRRSTITGKLLRELKNAADTVAFSHDGKWLASANRELIALWDPSTGKQMGELKEGANTLAFSPDGKQLASVHDGITLWELTTTPEKTGHIPSKQTGEVQSLAFSPDSKWLASGSADKNIKIWDASSGDEVQTLLGRGSVKSIAFREDGKQLASASGAPDPTVQIWDVSTWKELKSLAVNTTAVIAFSPDGHPLAIGSDDKKNLIKLWDVSTGKLRTFALHVDQVRSVAFSSDGKWLASGSYDNSVTIWDASVDHDVATESRGLCLTLNQDGTVLGGGDTDAQVKLWETAMGQKLHAVDELGQTIRSIACSQKANLLASVNDGTVKLWDASSGKLLRALLGNPGSPVKCAAFNQDGSLLATGDEDNELRLWTTARGELLFAVKQHSELPGSVTSIAFSPDGKLLATSSSDQKARIWDTKTGQKKHILSGHGNGVNCVAFDKDGKWLASASRDRQVIVWDVATGKRLHLLRGHSHGVTCIAFSPDGTRLASNGTDGIRLWDPSLGIELLRLLDQTSAERSVAFSPDGKWLVSSDSNEIGSNSRKVCLWNATRSQDVFTTAIGYETTYILGHSVEPYVTVAFSPNGELLASSFFSPSGASSFAIRNAKTGEESLPIQMFGLIADQSFSSDSRRFVGSYGNTIKLWDTSTAEELSALHDDTISYSVVLSPDGRLMASAGESTVKLWAESTGRVLHALPLQNPLTFSRDGRLAGIADDGTTNIWDASTARNLLTLKNKCFSVAFSPDGKWLASSALDGTVGLWDSSTGIEVRRLSGPGPASAPKQTPFPLAFSRDGKWLASGRGDNSIKVWDALSGEDVLTLMGHTKPVFSLSFTPDGQRMASGSFDGTMKVWPFKNLLARVALEGFKTYSEP